MYLTLPFLIVEFSWGFVRLTSGTGTDCFHHPQFQKNKKDLASKIVCASRSDKDAMGAREPKSNSKPPSLAGVEKFIRAKVLSAAASAVSNPAGVVVADSLTLKPETDL